MVVWSGEEELFVVRRRACGEGCEEMSSVAEIGEVHPEVLNGWDAVLRPATRGPGIHEGCLGFVKVGDGGDAKGLGTDRRRQVDGPQNGTCAECGVGTVEWNGALVRDLVC